MPPRYTARSRQDALNLLRGDGVPCNEGRGWYGTKPGCKRKGARKTAEKAKAVSKVKGSASIGGLRKTLQALDDRRQSAISQAAIDQSRINAAIEAEKSAPKRRKLEAERMKLANAATKTLREINDGRDQATIDYIQRNKTPATDRQTHGMSKAESLYGVPLGGMTLFAGGDIDRDSPIVAFARDFASRKPPYPASLLKHTKGVYFSRQKNNQDEVWENLYSTPGFASGATGGDGKITVYNGGGLSREMFAHEAGHNLATARYGSPTPDDRSYYATKTKGLPEVSPYASKSIVESFAEDVSRYFDTPIGQKPMKEAHPERYKIIGAIISGRKDKRSDRR